MDFKDTPFECDLEKYVSLDADIKSLSIEALRKHQTTRKLMGLVIDSAAALSNMSVSKNDKTIGEIRSNTFSPKYNIQLAYAMLDLAAIEGQTEVMVISAGGLIPAKLAVLPFDFDALGIETVF